MSLPHSLTGELAEKNPATAAFVVEYVNGTVDKDGEFSHLAHDDFNTLPLGNDEAEGNEADVEGEHGAQEVVTTWDLRQQLQQAAREKVSRHQTLLDDI